MQRFLALALLLCVSWTIQRLVAEEVVLARSAPLRKEPSSTSERVDALKAGNKLVLLSSELTNRYYHASFGDKQGWVHSSHLAKKAAPLAAPSTVKIGSFNVLHLGWGQSKDLKLLAGLIADYDVCALIEVMDNPPTKALEETLALVTKERTNQDTTWTMFASEPVGRNTYQERYAFVYRTDRVQVVQPGEFLDDTTTFDRTPYYATFKSGNFDFTLIAVHITFGKKESDRKDEIFHLRNAFEQVQASNGKEQDVILMGDFNLPANHAYWKNLTNETTMTGTASVTHIVNLIPATTKTSIGTKGYASSYDNIWIDTTHTSHEYTNNASANQFVATLFPDEEQPFQRAREIISDHIPIGAEFKTDQEDDDQ